MRIALVDITGRTHHSDEMTAREAVETHRGIKVRMQEGSIVNLPMGNTMHTFNCRNVVHVWMLVDAEQVVERFDSYSQEEHAEGIELARERAEAREAERRARAKVAVKRLLNGDGV